jgi:adenylate kinase
MDEELINIPDSANLQYINQDEFKIDKRIFVSYCNSYHGNEIVKKILDLNENSESSQIFYKISGTIQSDKNVQEKVEILNSKSENFLETVLACDVLICDISVDKNQLAEAKSIVNYCEQLLESGRVKPVKIILISTIMTWARTKSLQGDIHTDLHYRKRRPHPCFNEHLLLERKVMSLQKKFKNLVHSTVICPGIIYGMQEDIFHFIFKKCYFNHPQIEIFAPACNFLPIIYIHDFTRILIEIVQKYPGIERDYVLAVQPECMSCWSIVEAFAQSMGGPEMRIKVCDQNDIFLMDKETMTVNY